MPANANEAFSIYITKWYSSTVIARWVFQTRTFARWAFKAGVSDAQLLRAVEELSGGLIDAQLGGALVKKRVAISGKGKRSGGRTLVATNLKDRWIFLFGFGKNERDNVNLSELTALRELAKTYLELNESQLATAVTSGELIEVKNDTETEKQNLERGAGIRNRPL